MTTTQGNSGPVPYQPEQLREMAEFLLDIARRIGPEGEGMEVDGPYTMEQLVQLRSFLSSTRTAIDKTNSALARYWNENYPGEVHEDKYHYWSVGQAKKKTIVDGDMFLGWLASLDAERLGKVFNPNRLAEVVKVTGMSPAERDTHISEGYSPTSGISINKKEKK